MSPSQTSIESMVRDHGPYLQRLARALVGDLSRADDLVAETWAAAVAATQSSNLTAASIREPRSWLATVLRRRARHGYRSDALRGAEPVSEAHASQNQDQVGVALQLERERLLHGALERLDEPYRTALYLRYREGLPPRKIAERTGVPVKTVNSRLSRGLEKMRDELGKSYGGGDEGRRAWLSAVVPLAVMRTRHVAWLAPAKMVAAAVLLVAAGVAGAALMASSPEAPAVSTTTTGLASLASSVEATPVELAGPAAARPAASEARAAAPLTGMQAGELPGFRVRLLGADGAPLADEKVYMLTSRRPGRPTAYFSAQTDEGGVASFDWAGSRYVWCYNGSGTASFRTEVEPSTQNVPLDEVMEIELRVHDEVEVSITARDASGAAVPGALVHAIPDVSSRLLSAPVGVCDVGGQCHVKVAESVILYVSAPGRATSERLEVDRLPEVSQGIRGATFALGAPGATVSGRVRDAEGEAVANAWVRVTPEDVVLARGASGKSRILAAISVQAEPDGSFELRGDLYPRAYQVTAFADGYAAKTQRVEIGSDPRAVDFTLGNGATVSGRVMLADGTSAVRSSVRYCKVGGSGDMLRDAPYHGMSTDVDGRFELVNVPAGDLVFLAGPGQGMSPARARVERSISTSGTVNMDLTLDFSPRISGRVVDEAGLPVAGLIIEAELGQFTRYSWRTYTKEDGSFDLTALPEPAQFEDAGAKWELEFSQDGASPRPILGRASGLEPGTTGIEVVVPRPVEASSFLTGRLVRTDGPISSAVKVFIAGEETYGTLGDLQVDPVDGSFTYGPVGAGIYRLYISDPNKDSVGQLGMEVAAGETLDVGVIDMSRGGHLALSIDLALPGGIPESVLPGLMRNQHLVLLGPGGHKRWLPYEDGAFRNEEPLEPGEWQLVRESGKRVVLPATMVTIEPRATNELTLQGRLARPLVARVLMPTDGTWDSAAIRVYTEDGVEMETSEALTPAELDDLERLELEVDSPMESVRVVLVVDGAESDHEVTVAVPYYTEMFDGIEMDAR